MGAVIVWFKQFAHALVSAVAFVVLTVTVIWVNEPYFWATTYAGTWEIAALITTFFSIAGYWWFQMTSCRDFGRTWVFATCQVLLVLSGVATFVAMKSVWDEHGVEAWIVSTTGVTAHSASIRVTLVCIIGLAFALHDWLVWNWCTDVKKSQQARILCLVDDVPIAAALFVLFLFNARYPFSWAVWPQGWQLLFNLEGAVYTLQYFVAGAMAFQMLVSNVVYFMIIFFEVGNEAPPVS